MGKMGVKMSVNSCANFVNLNRLVEILNGPIGILWQGQPAEIIQGKGSLFLDIREWDLYPNDTTSGNFGTIDLGAANNSTADLQRQILGGVNSQDLSAMGGEIKLGSDGTLPLQGDTGISAAIKSTLEQIVGQQRILPLYSTVQGTGNTTVYTIVGFAGVRIMGVRLTGAKKALVVQLGSISSPWATVDPNLSAPNNLVYTTPRLPR